MTTTLTLDQDVRELLDEEQRRSGRSFDATVNEALRTVLAGRRGPLETPGFEITAFVDGLSPEVDPDKLNQLVDVLETREATRKLRA